MAAPGSATHVTLLALARWFAASWWCAQTTLALASPQETIPRTVSLASEWNLLIDERDTGVRDRVWEVRLPDRIRLPGMVHTVATEEPPAGLETVPWGDASRGYCGVAWYQRDVTIPYAWRRRRITLFLERCSWKTTVWVDQTLVGTQESLATPHVYDITEAARPGVHRVTIRVDNRPKAYETGSEGSAARPAWGWNGILGAIELRSTARVWMDDVQLYPDSRTRRMRVRLRLQNLAASFVRVRVEHEVLREDGTAEWRFATIGTAGRGETWLEGTVALPSTMQLWDLFHPRAYTLRSSMKASDGRTTWLNSRTTAFGVRNLAADQRFISLNGSPVLLRGAILHPLPPGAQPDLQRRAWWDRLMGALRAVGLNHLRCAGWCPPDPAFDAADRAGVALLVELPALGQDLNGDPQTWRSVLEEARRIRRTFGNHPSLVMLALGGRVTRDAGVLENIVGQLKWEDRRCLYAATCVGSVTGADDFHVVVVPAGWNLPAGAGAEQTGNEHTCPVIAHVLGTRQQKAVRMGAVRVADPTSSGQGDELGTPEALEAARGTIERLLGMGMLAGFQVDLPLGLFLRPSETPLARRAGIAGDLRGWCGDSVVLATIPSRVLVTTDALRADLAVAHFGPNPLQATRLTWTVSDERNEVIGGGALLANAIAPGEVRTLGHVECSLAKVQPPARLRLRVVLGEDVAANAWTVYVYSPDDPGAFAEGVYVTRRLSREVLQRVTGGGRVVLLADIATLRRSAPAHLAWDRAGGPGPGILGIVCDPDHRSLAEFPTDAWADIQWHDILRRSRYFLLPSEDLAAGLVLAPVAPARDLTPALVFECRVGEGRLLVCSFDLTSESEYRPEARQLLKSLLDYATSDAFRPAVDVSPSVLAVLLRVAGGEDTYAANPPNPDDAALWVRCGALKSQAGTVPWERDLDIVLAKDENVSYETDAAVADQGAAAGWTSGEQLEANIAAPAALAGTLWCRIAGDARSVLHFSIGRTVEETVALPSGRAVWVRFALTETDRKDGNLRIRITAERGSWKVLDIALTRPAP